MHGAFVFLALSAALQAEAQSPTRFFANLKAGKPQTLVAFGTSLTAGGAWVGLTDKYLKERFPGLAAVNNEGASGHSSKYGLQIIHNVTRHKPDLVLIEFCMNDSYYPERDGFKEGVTVAGSLANLGSIVDSIKAVNPACEILLQTMDLPLGIHRVRRPKVEEYHAGYREFAKARGFGLIDHALRWQAVLAFDTALYVSWLPDSIHPSAAGSGAITFPAVVAALAGNNLALESPAAGAVFPPGTAIQMRAAISQPAGEPAGQVDFFQGKTRLGQGQGTPAVFAWAGAAQGRYLVMARLMAGETAVAISDLRAVEVKAGSRIAGQGNRNATAARLSPRSTPVQPGFWLGRRSATSR